MKSEEKKSRVARIDTKRIAPIVFPFATSKVGYAEIFEALEKNRSVIYLWKEGKMIVKGCEDVRVVHEEFARVLGVSIPTSFDMIWLLSLSGVRVKVCSADGYLPKKQVEYLEGLYHELYELPRVKIDEALTKMLYGILTASFEKPVMTGEEHVFYSTAQTIAYTEDDKRKMLEVVYGH